MTYNEIANAGGTLGGGYIFRRLVTIPADTFSESTDYYLGLVVEGIGENIVMTDLNNIRLGSRIRNYCVTSNRTHVFAEVSISNPAIDNSWYLHHN